MLSTDETAAPVVRESAQASAAQASTASTPDDEESVPQTSVEGNVLTINIGKIFMMFFLSLKVTQLANTNKARSHFFVLIRKEEDLQCS